MVFYPHAMTIVVPTACPMVTARLQVDRRGPVGAAPHAHLGRRAQRHRTRRRCRRRRGAQVCVDALRLAHGGTSRGTHPGGDFLTKKNGPSEKHNQLFL